MLSDSLRYVIEFLENCPNIYADAVGSLKYVEAELIDLNHKIELDTTLGVNSLRTLAQLEVEKRRERRYYKDTVALYEDIAGICKDIATHKTIGKFKRVLEQIEKVETLHEVRGYNPRTDLGKALFETDGLKGYKDYLESLEEDSGIVETVSQ